MNLSNKGRSKITLTKENKSYRELIFGIRYSNKEL